MKARVLSMGLLSAIALVALLGAESAFACSCVQPEPEKYLRESDAAVIGRLVGVTPHGLQAEYKYRLRQVVKGPSDLHRGQLLIVHSARDGAACGLPSARQRSYGLFLDGAPGDWSSISCQVILPEEMREASRGETSMRHLSTCS